MRWAKAWVFAAAMAAGSAGAQVKGIDSLAWLAGCWKADGAEAGSNEHWLAPAGGTMMGVGRTVKGGRTVDHEFMRIASDDQGRLVFHAMPANKAPAAFTAIQHDEGGVTFENPRDEFPQRVIYRRNGPDKLAARIEGLRNGQPRGIDFPMTRC